MKKIILSILISLTGLIIMAVSYMFVYNISDLLYKFVTFFGAMLFGGGIAILMVSRASKKNVPPKDED